MSIWWWERMNGCVKASCNIHDNYDILFCFFFIFSSLIGLLLQHVRSDGSRRLWAIQFVTLSWSIINDLFPLTLMSSKGHHLHLRFPLRWDFSEISFFSPFFMDSKCAAKRALLMFIELIFYYEDASISIFRAVEDAAGQRRQMRRAVRKNLCEVVFQFYFKNH